MATHSNILAWRLPWPEEPGGLQFMGSQRVGHNGSDLTTTNYLLTKFCPHYVQHFLLAALATVLYPDDVFTNYLWTLKSSALFSLTLPCDGR